MRSIIRTVSTGYLPVALSAESEPAGTYIRMMKHNISEIEKALAAGPA